VSAHSTTKSIDYRFSYLSTHPRDLKGSFAPSVSCFPGPQGSGWRDKIVRNASQIVAGQAGAAGSCRGGSRRLTLTLRWICIDLYQIHRWDFTTPFEETLEALYSLVRKVRYLGASIMAAWQNCKAGSHSMFHAVVFYT
jgi:hypothetical protein